MGQEAAVIPEEAVEAAARVFYGAAYGSVGAEGNKVLLDGAREALTAAFPALRLAILREEISLGDDWQVEDPRISYVDVQVEKETYLEVHGGGS
jgi:hypothetical protein